MTLTKTYIDDDAFFSKCDKEGVLVYAIKQTQTHPMLNPTNYGQAGKHGYCHGLSVLWIKARKAGEDFDYDRVNKVCNDPPIEAVHIQNAFLNMAATDTITDSGYWVPKKLHDSFQSQGLTIRNTSIALPITSYFFTQRLSLRKGLYYFTLPGHAIAAQATQSEYRLFDADFGHFCFSKLHQFEKWLDQYLTVSGYGLGREKMYLYMLE